MNECIKKDDVIDKFIEGDGDDEFTEGYNFAVNEYREKIKAMPAADVMLVKHGRWSECFTDSRIYSGICSECGGGAIRSVKGKPLDYCPNCTARMDLEDESNSRARIPKHSEQIVLRCDSCGAAIRVGDKYNKLHVKGQKYCFCSFCIGLSEFTAKRGNI